MNETAKLLQYLMDLPDFSMTKHPAGGYILSAGNHTWLYTYQMCAEEMVLAAYLSLYSRIEAERLVKRAIVTLPSNKVII